MTKIEGGYAARDLDALLHPITNLHSHEQSGPLVLDRGHGIWVFDAAGRPYIDGLAGLWCTSLGHGHPEIVEAARAQMSRLSFGHLFGGRSHEAAIALGEQIKAIAPVAASKVFFATSGSEANETQIKLLWHVNNLRGLPRKKKIISRHRAYHGTTIATASLTGLPLFHEDFDLPMARVLFTDCPHYWRLAQSGESEGDFATRMAANLEKLILDEGPETIAAFIAEPIQGAGGVIIPPAAYFAKIQAVLDRYDIRLIADEVICGFGRTGAMFGSQTFGIRPNSISMAKAITSGYAPLSAMTVSEADYDLLVSSSAMRGVFAHGFTYSGHPLACAVALKCLEIYQRINIVDQVRSVAQIFKIRLRALADHPLVGEARGCGLIGAVELVADKTAKSSFDPVLAVGATAVAFAQAEGLLCRAVAGDNLALCPPLVINGAEINELFDRLARALDRTLDWSLNRRL